MLDLYMLIEPFVIVSCPIHCASLVITDETSEFHFVFPLLLVVVFFFLLINQNSNNQASINHYC